MRLINKNHDEFGAMAGLALLAIIDSLICLCTLGRYNGTLEETALFSGDMNVDSPTFWSAIKAAFSKELDQ